MDVKQLRYFREVARMRSFTAAAASLFITQPALSKQIAELEEELGQMLFDRTTRRIELTEKGAMLLRRAEKILELVERTRQEVMEKQELAGELSIAAAETPAMKIICETVADFTREHANVRVKLQSCNAIDAAFSLKMGTADIGVFNMPADLTGFDYFFLTTQNRWGILTRRDGAFQGKTSVSLPALSGMPLFVPRQDALRHLLVGRTTPDAELYETAGTYNLLYNASLLVRSGANALCISGIVKADDEVMFLPLEPELATDVAVAWLGGSQAPALTRAFVRALRGKAGATS